VELTLKRAYDKARPRLETQPVKSDGEKLPSDARFCICKPPVCIKYRVPQVQRPRLRLNWPILLSREPDLPCRFICK
jgi:hypothetical protein